MTPKIEKIEPIEIIIIDRDKFFVELTQIYFEMENVIYKEVVGFAYASDALQYLSKSKDKSPKLILLETIDNSGQHDFSFFEEYSLLERNDFIYVVTVSIQESAKAKCLSYGFVKKYIYKPIEDEDIRDMVNEHVLTNKEIKLKEDWKNKTV